MFSGIWAMMYVVQEAHALIERYLVPALLVFSMLGMGAALTVRDFARVVGEGRSLTVGLVLQLVYVPLFTAAFVFVSGMSEGWAVGLCLVAAVPGGALSNLLTHVGRGRVALSIALTLVATLAAMVTVPFVLGLLASEYLPSTFAFPRGRITSDIGLYLLLPLAVGMGLHHLWPQGASRFSPWAVRVALGLLLVLIVSSLASGRIDVLGHGVGPPLRIIAFGALLLVTTLHLSRLCGLHDPDSLAIGIEVVVRNVALALFLVKFFFADDDRQAEVLYTCLFYAGMSWAVAAMPIVRHRGGRSIVAFREPHPPFSASSPGRSHR